MDGAPSLNTSIRVVIRNLANKEVRLYLEPWGEEFPMPFESEFVLVGHGPEKSSGFRVDYDERSIVVSGWTGSTVQVFSNGEELGNISWRPPVPDI